MESSSKSKKESFPQNKPFELFLNNILYFVWLFFDILKFLAISLIYCVKQLMSVFFKNEKDVSGQLILITGGGNGLGRSLALKFADKNANIAIADIDLESAQQTVAEILKKGVKAKAYKVDISDQKQIDYLRKEISKDFGEIDILVNNAAIVAGLSFEECEPDAIRRMVNVNVTANLLMIKTFLSDMIKSKKGHIVTISSMSAIYPFSKNLTYSATKHAINGLMLSLNEYLRERNLDSFIKTSCVMPLFIDTIPVVSNEYRNPNSRTILMTVDYAARKALKGILREETLFSIPYHLKFVINFVNMLPIKLQQQFRDIIVNENLK